MTPRRVLVAVKPRMLADVLALRLRESGDEVIIDLTGTHPPVDAAIVSGVIDDHVLAPVIIFLPDDVGNAGEGRVERQVGSGSRSQVIDVRRPEDVFAALDRHVPAAGP